ncbi:histidinol phosphatase-like enzyme (inositol monophosphatase family) [Litorimonas taeanensis]|uniref:Histidinol phosphatase-like enzyme (Inositol monophosphatase family) n=1 Tax=Litorimonas taeanensis TaxID=568099 RepID=A0A420WFB7_9PROT|nr:inositol monophosphatase family protein [Litorimonas taeanensis]RKQ69666.1 histidinol phosphatase-like enzyme (inositol monophosphatase family) [Litorimonas taeanensis]
MTLSPQALELDINARLEFMGALSNAARAITLPLFQSPEGIVNKAEKTGVTGEAYDPVTKADIEAEIALRKMITAQFPQDSIEGEECPDYVGENDFSWTLDPIDGTRAFVAGVPVWSTLIALSYKGQPVLGLIDVAALDKCYFGRTDAANKSAWCIHKGEAVSLKTSPCDDLRDAILGCTEPLSMLKPGELAAYNIIRRGVKFSRLGLDALGYALIAEGRMNIVIEALLKPCDVRALMPVIEGAGGKMTNWYGGSPVDGGRVVAVSDAALLPELYTYLQRAMDPR